MFQSEYQKKNYTLHLQEASYLKMCSTKLEPRHGSDQTTACISTKFGKSVSFKHTIRTIEAIFNIWPLSQDTGPLGGTPEGSKIVKIFFRFFAFFQFKQLNWCLYHYRNALVSPNSVFFEIFSGFHLCMSKFRRRSRRTIGQIAR